MTTPEQHDDERVQRYAEAANAVTERHELTRTIRRADDAEAKVAEMGSVTNPTLSERRHCRHCKRPMVTCALYCPWCGTREVGNIGAALDGGQP